MIKFKGYNICPQFLRSDKSFRITIDLSKDQIKNVEDILLQRLPEGISYKITIEPDISDKDVTEVF